MSESIEDIILANDKRGVAQLRPYLPVDYCIQAARFTLEHPGNVVIATGILYLDVGQRRNRRPAGSIGHREGPAAAGQKRHLRQRLPRGPGIARVGRR